MKEEFILNKDLILALDHSDSSYFVHTCILSFNQSIAVEYLDRVKSTSYPDLYLRQLGDT